MITNTELVSERTSVVIYYVISEYNASLIWRLALFYFIENKS